MIDRARMKKLVENLLVGSGVCRVGIRKVSRHSLVLAYHNVIPEGQDEAVGERSLHLPQAAFAAQLDHLMETHEVVPLDRLYETDSPSRPRVAITFDDAYRGAMTAGMAELAARGLSATVFVAPGLLGRASFWWDAFVQKEEHDLAEGFRQRALEEHRGCDTAIRSREEGDGSKSLPMPPHARPSTVAELSDAAGAMKGLTLGSHSWSHRALPYLSDVELRNELTRSFEWLRMHHERIVPWISYPYGLASRRVESAAKEAGYMGGLRICGGWVGTKLREPFAAPRMNIPGGLSINGFRLRTAGVIRA